MRNCNGLLRKVLRSLIEDSHHLGAIGRVDTLQFAAGRYTLAANHERILATKLALHLFDGSTHSPRILFFAEISQRFVAKFSCHIQIPASCSRFLPSVIYIPTPRLSEAS